MKKRTEKERRLLIAEVLILAAAILAVLLPQLIGTVSRVREPGDIKREEDLNGRVIGAVSGSGLETQSRERWSESEIYYAAESSELPKLAADGTIDAFLAPSEEVRAILASNPELTALPDDGNKELVPDGEDAEERVTVIINKKDYGYLATSRTLDSLSAPGTRFAALTGSELADFPARIYPEGEILSYNSFIDMFEAVENGKADAAVAYLTFCDMVQENYKDLAFITTPLSGVTYGFGTRQDEKGDKLKAELNAYIAEMNESGEMQRIAQKWESATEDYTPELEYTYSGENGVLRICTPAGWFPMTYYSGNKLVGRFVDTACDFCAKYGYTPEFECVDYPTEVAGLSSGAYDIMADSLYITPERLERINITDPVLGSEMYIVVKSEPETETVSASSVFAERLKDGFRGNFIKEERWKMLLGGLKLTLLISLLSCAFGTLLGAVICRMRMSGNTFAEAFARIYIRALQGIPILVLLLVLYYIVFADDNASAFRISVLGFSLDFSAYVSEIFRSGIEAVPEGQSRAAKALGFTPVQGFVKVVLPQAMKHILPVYSGQLVSMVKLTSVAGYISVMELTKVTDIIRSRTFDAFFPLITATIIYFLMSNILTGVMKLASRRLGQGAGSRRLAGLDTSVDNSRGNSGTGAVPAAERGKEILVIEHLAKSFGEVTPLKDVSCSISSGDVISVIGPSGTGKSTLLNLINRLEEPDDGGIILDGEDTRAAGYNYSRLRRRVGMVFQSFNLFAHLTIVENVMLAQTELLKRTRREAYERSMELLGTVGLAGKALSYPSELSGGQQQRAAIARAIAMDPEIVLFDEPTSALDPTMVGEVLSVIRNLAQKGTTMLVVTHEMKFARDVSNRVFYMDEGVIYEEGSPAQIFEAPVRDKTRQFINHLKIFDHTLADEQADVLEMLSAVDEFSRRNMIPQRLLNKLLTVTEELCINICFAGYGKAGAVEFSFEYSPEEQYARFTVDFTGEHRDPLEGADQISVKLLKNVMSEYSCRQSGDRDRIEGCVRE